MSDRDVARTGRGEWAVAAAIALAGVGIAAGSQVLVVAAILPLGYAAVAVLGAPQSPPLRVSREFAVDDAPASETTAAGDDSAAVSVAPDATVTVRTTIQNVGSEAVVDLRAVDGVPEPLTVVDGTPRACVALEPLETATLEYELAVRRGEHAFDDATVRTRDLSGTVTATRSVATTGPDAVRCSPPVEDVPLEGGTNDYAGEVPTDEGGSGVEFYSVRDYEPGDPVGSIDWRRYANTRELATVEYRAERATRIVCIVDARNSQYLAASQTDRPAIDRSLAAAERTVETLLDAGHPTGVAAVYEGGVDTVPPGTAPETRERVQRILETIRGRDQQFSFLLRSRSSDLSADLAPTLPGEAQVYLFSSFVDDDPIELVEGLRTRGYAVRVVSPDVTDGDAPADRLEALDRRLRLARARACGARVVDWDREQPLGLALRNALGEVRR